MKILALLLMIATLTGCKPPSLPALSTPQTRDVTGQIFVTLDDGQTLKSSLAEVRIVKRMEAQTFLNQRSNLLSPQLIALAAELKVRQEEVDEMHGKANRLEEEADRLGQLSSRAASDRAHQDRTESIRLLTDCVGLLDKNQKAKAEAPKQNDFIFTQTWPATLTNVVTDADGRFKVTLPATADCVIIASWSRQAKDKEESYDWFIPVTGQADYQLNNLNLYKISVSPGQ